MADDDIWDSWEDFADSSELDKHVDQHLRLTNGSSDEEQEEMNMKMKSKTEDSPTSDPLDVAKSTAGQFRILPRPVVHEDDVNRTAYTPQVKILRRPGQDAGGLSAKDKDKKSQPARTLAEREAAYAEARKRIMGPVTSQSNSVSTNSKSRADSRKGKSSKQENVERLPKGPDKSGRGFNYPR